MSDSQDQLVDGGGRAECSSMDRIDAVLAAAVAHVGGQQRSGQSTMAHAVAGALATEQHALIQAGTGTGKSLGYLVPTALHSERVVIATATLALQQQLLESDVPALSEALALAEERAVKVAIVKGRRNYACLRKVRDTVEAQDSLFDEEPEAPGELGAEVIALRTWAERAAEIGGVGDREEAPSHTDRAWLQVSVSARECIGASRCAFGSECFAERAREEANHASLVITNHAMLAIDAIEGVPMLPDYDAVVIDEAHELVSRVTQAASDALDPLLVERAAKRARPYLDDESAADRLDDAAGVLEDVLKHTSPGVIADDSVVKALTLVRDSARSCFSSFAKGEQQNSDVEAHAAKTLVDDVRKIAERMASQSESDVLWFSDARFDFGLRIAPVDVASVLSTKVFAEKTAILTSATLALGGSFEPIARSLGLTLGEHEWHGIDVGSPFDYSQQGILYAAKHLPPPGRSELGGERIDEIAALIEAAGGRTLALFSSRRAAEEAAAAMRERFDDFEILCQGDAHLSELLTEFADTERSCLFGSLSLWQGVDVPGPTCSLVIIDRIPFPRPDDPVMGARQKRVEKFGGNGFMTVAAHHAALLLAQGAGRLIRRQEDKGVVAILDPRIVTARYGSFLVNSLPQMHRTIDREVALGALRRLAVGRQGA